MKFIISGLIGLCLIAPSSSIAQLAPKEKQIIISSLDKRLADYAVVSDSIWSFAELGYIEFKSSNLLQQTLKNSGFQVEANVGGIPTAFVATYGNGKPVIGILAEFDALPGLSQEAVPNRVLRANQVAGHACGHHLFGTASVAAAISVKEWMIKSRFKGTVKVFGTPAEEGGSGKVYMARAGLFDDTDVMLHWHPSSTNSSSSASCLAIKSAKFRFHGISSHAGGAPERGRSALDGVEAMNAMANMMREHIPQEARLHYVITNGGDAPNVVPAEAEVYYYIRHPQMRDVKSIFDRLVKCAEGAALGTETKMDFEVTGGSYNVLPNGALAKLVDDNLNMVGGVVYTDEEIAFAKEIMSTYPDINVTPQDAARIEEFYVTDRAVPYSTDVGDVSWLVPTIGLTTATWVPGTIAHSWQAVAAGGMSIGHKGMINAAKTIALTAIDLYMMPEVIQAAKDELKRRQGGQFHYEALLGDREPPLDYRVKR